MRSKAAPVALVAIAALAAGCVPSGLPPLAGGPACLAPDAVDDADVRRNTAEIAAAPICLTRASVSDGALTWRFVSLANRAHPDGPVWYLPHDNENTAFDAALYAVRRYGGQMVALEADERRFHAGLDPNRAFALSAGTARACGLAEPLPNYTRFVERAFAGRQAILTLHNNAAGPPIAVGARSDKLTTFAADGRYGDPDHLVFTAGRRALEEDRGARGRVEALGARGLNVAYERVDAANNDCSLSNYAALNDRRPYYNVEALHGSDLQRGMVDELMAVLGRSPVGE